MTANSSAKSWSSNISRKISTTTRGSDVKGQRGKKSNVKIITLPRSLPVNWHLTRASIIYPSCWWEWWSAFALSLSLSLLDTEVRQYTPPKSGFLVTVTMAIMLTTLMTFMRKPIEWYRARERHTCFAYRLATFDGEMIFIQHRGLNDALSLDELITCIWPFDGRVVRESLLHQVTRNGVVSLPKTLRICIVYRWHAVHRETVIH